MKKIPVISRGPRPSLRAPLAERFGGPKNFGRHRVQIRFWVIFCRFLLFIVDILGVMGPFLAQTFLAQTLGPGGTKMAKIGV